MSYATWLAVEFYLIGDIVNHNGVDYQAVADNHNSMPPSADWIVLPTGGGIQSINALVNPAILFKSPDASITITQSAPDTINLQTAVPPVVAPSFGSFYSDVPNFPVPFPIGNAAPIPISQTSLTSGDITLSPPDTILLKDAGIYLVNISVQITNSGGTTTESQVWVKQGTIGDVPFSNSQIEVQNGLEAILSVEYMIKTTGADSIQFITGSDVNNNGSIETIAVSPSHPVASPAIIVNIHRIA